MSYSNHYTIRTALIVAVGGFLMGFDASVISGVVTFIESDFSLSKFELGWSVASLTLSATLAMIFAGPFSDRFGRRPLLVISAVFFTVSSLASAMAPNFGALVVARMLGGISVGTTLIVAPMYIAEISPPAVRGRTVSFNQLNIVMGISAAFFSNYLILKLGKSDPAWGELLGLGERSWRFMLGVEAVPAVAYLFALSVVPESPRWLILQGRQEEARRILKRMCGCAQANSILQSVQASLQSGIRRSRPSYADLFHPAMKLVLTVGIAVAILQQITGINAVFFYAPMIFEQSGIGTDASFLQAVLVGLVNLAFTILAMLLIDRVGRRPLLGIGLAGIALSMLLLSYGFGSATYTLDSAGVNLLSQDAGPAALQGLVDQTYYSDVAFRDAVVAVAGSEAFRGNQAALVGAAINMNPGLILFGILGFVASFAISVGPVMWVLFSELFPNRIRGFAISFVGVINSTVSFGVQLVFPWELERIGSSGTFLIYGIFAVVGLLVVMRTVPETKGRSLERLEAELAGPRPAGRSSRPPV